MIFKKLVLGLLLLPVLCLAYTERVYKQIEYAWELERNGNHVGAVTLMSQELADPDLEDVDRLHVLMARSMFWMALDREDLWLEDQNEVLLLKRKSAECAREWALNYD